MGLTLMVELAVAHVWWHALRYMSHGNAPPHARLLAACAAASLITHPFVWLWALVLFADAASHWREGVIEVLITTVEGTGLHFALKGYWRASGFQASVLAIGMSVSSVIFGYGLGWAFELSGSGFSIKTSVVSWALGIMLV